MGDARGQAGHHALHRFFIAPDAIDGDRTRFTTAQWHQICRVLRLSRGDLVLVCDGSGMDRVVSIGDPTSSTATVVVTRAGRSEPRCRVHLYQSALRGDSFAWLLQKATEVGVSAVTPVLFSRTQEADYARRMDRYRAIVREAAEQCERSSLPFVGDPLSLEAVLAGMAAGEQHLGLLLDEHEERRPLRSTMGDWWRTNSAASLATVSVVVGPEGGLTRSERAAAVARSLEPVGLGPRILRSETAGLVAATLVLGVSGDLG
jgi:16S rRNA (uracil1498-N3)-methyltransferase